MKLKIYHLFNFPRSQIVQLEALQNPGKTNSAALNQASFQDGVLFLFKK